MVQRPIWNFDTPSICSCEIAKLSMEESQKC
jgi:hypothetical protein